MPCFLTRTSHAKMVKMSSKNYIFIFKFRVFPGKQHNNISGICQFPDNFSLAVDNSLCRK